MCYRFDLLEFEDCLFENVDATYILHLEGNGRIDHIHEQLKSYHPTKKVYIVYNKGYKKCEKELKKQTVGNDIVHANITVFEHALQYKHILVLEDDFIFSKEVMKHSKHVDTFLKRNTSFVYQLGSHPIIALPIDMYHYRVFGVLAHANIYSPSSRKKLMDDYRQNKMNDDLGGLDSYTRKILPLYMYHKPLCYQTFPMTESRQKTWFKDDFMSQCIKYIGDYVLYLLNLENEPEPGFTIMYWFAKLIPFILFFLLIWLFSYIPSCLSCKNLKSKRVR